MRIFVALFLLISVLAQASQAHEFNPDQVEVMDAEAEVLDGDTTTLFVQMTIANGAPTTKILGFETDQGKIGDWIEIRRFFGREQLKVLEEKTVRTKTLYNMHRPDSYLIITNIDPIVYTCEYGFILVDIVFEDGERVPVAAWIDPLYTQICG